MLNNMKRLIAANLSTRANGFAYCKSLDGGTAALSVTNNYRYYMESALIRFAIGNGYGIMFGTSNDPVTEDDYHLHGTVFNGNDITVVVPSAVISPTISDEFIGFTAAFTITARKAVTIGEMGVAFCTESSQSASNSAMMDRVVFEEPIVIQKGETKTITYRMKIG